MRREHAVPPEEGLANQKGGGSNQEHGGFQNERRDEGKLLGAAGSASAEPAATDDIKALVLAYGEACRRAYRRDVALANLLAAIEQLGAGQGVPDELRLLSAKATPGRWHWWTSNSWLRLGTDARGYDRNGVPFGQDGYIAYPYVSRSDQHPDLCIRNEADQALIPAAVNFLRDLLARSPAPNAEG